MAIEEKLLRQAKALLNVRGWLKDLRGNPGRRGIVLLETFAQESHAREVVLCAADLDEAGRPATSVPLAVVIDPEDPNYIGAIAYRSLYILKDEHLNPISPVKPFISLS